MYSVCMDSTRGICVFLIILVQQVHVQCEDSNTTFAVPDVTVIQARCLARCYNLVSAILLFYYRLGSESLNDFIYTFYLQTLRS